MYQLCTYPVVQTIVDKFNDIKVMNVHKSPSRHLFVQQTVSGYPTSRPIRISRSDLSAIYQIEV